jgi:hypothetical protein
MAQRARRETICDVSTNLDLKRDLGAAPERLTTIVRQPVE